MRNPKFHVKISFFAAIMDILNFACDVISVPLPENKENFLYNQLISENIEGVVFHEIFLKSGFTKYLVEIVIFCIMNPTLGKKGPNSQAYNKQTYLT